jgi:hypothetical protein
VPVEREAGSAAFCPRCGTQYRAGVQVCADCAGVALVTHRDAPDR